MDIVESRHVQHSLSKSNVGARGRSWLASAHGAVAIITCLGLALRLWGLADKSLWIDETFSIGMVAQDWGSFWHTLLFVQPNMEFYYILQKLLATITPTAWQHGEFFWRLLPALAGAATIPAIFALTAQLFGTRAGVLAAALLAVNEFMVEYSQQARGYTLFVLLLTLAYLMLVRWLAGAPRTLRWFAVLSVLAFLTQAFEVVFLAAQLAFIGIVMLRGRALDWRRFLVALVPVAIIMAVRYRLYASHPDQVSWIARPQLHDLTVGTIQLVGGDGKHVTQLSYYLLAIFLVAGFVLIAWTILPTLRDSKLLRYQPIAFAETTTGPALDRIEAVALIALWLTVAIPGIWLASQVKPLWVPRYIAPASVAICITLAAAGNIVVLLMKNRQHRDLAFSAMCLLAIGGWFIPLHHYLARPAWEDWRGAAYYVAVHFQPGDGIICYDNTWGCNFGFSHYFDAVGGPAHFDPQAPGAFSWQVYGQQNRSAVFAQAVAPDALTSYRAQHPRLWFLLGHYWAGAGDWKGGTTWLSAHARAVTKQVFDGNIYAYLFEFGGS